MISYRCKSCGRPVRKDGATWVHYDGGLAHHVDVQAISIGPSLLERGGASDDVSFYGMGLLELLEIYNGGLRTIELCERIWALVSVGHEDVERLICSTDIAGDAKLHFLREFDITGFDWSKKPRRLQRCYKELRKQPLSANAQGYLDWLQRVHHYPLDTSSTSPDGTGLFI